MIPETASSPSPTNGLEFEITQILPAGSDSSRRRRGFATGVRPDVLSERLIEAFRLDYLGITPTLLGYISHSHERVSVWKRGFGDLQGDAE